MNRKSYFSLFIAGAALLVSEACAAQNLGFEQDDYIKVQAVFTDAQIAPLPLTQRQTTRVYYDGLGRPLQTVAEQASPLQNDMIQPVAYDNLGRQTVSYLPYTDIYGGATGSYRSTAITTEQPNFYNQTGQYLIAGDGAPYSQKVFENSPLQRLLEAGMVGSGFQPGGSGTQHFKTVNYRPNSSTADGNILQWNLNGTYTANTFYAPNSLWVTDATDEDGVETRIFKDLEGHTILKRQLLGSANLDTYYLYNTAGMLIYIVPPNAANTLVPTTSFNLSSAPLSNLVFYFVYDGMGRLVQKTVPAKGVISIVYDPLSRPVLIQDANMAGSNEWNYIKYDTKGRAISQGIYTDNITTPVSHIGWANMQSYVNGLAGSYNTAFSESRTGTLTNGGYYTDNIFPTGQVSGTTLAPLAYAYYDDYNMTQSGSANFVYVPQTLPNEETQTSAAVKGMPTIVSKTTVGAAITTTLWLTSATFYDHRLHPIQTISNNHVYYTGYTATINLTDSKTIVPDFTGVPQVSYVVKQTGASTTTKVLSTFTYDQVYRLSTITQSYNGGTATQVAAYTYNEIGQMVARNLGQVATGTIPANLTLNSYSSPTAAASNSITLNPTFTVPSGSVFNAFITSATGYLQTVDYRYNIRGQVLSINNSKLSNDGGVTNVDNNDLFGMTFQYDQVDGYLNNGTGNSPSFDGKLTGIKWMSRDGIGYERSYSVTYDQLNRYKAEMYAERTAASTGAFNNNVHGFDENNITYDYGGNILTLNRNSSTEGTNSSVQIDRLTYTYNTATDPNQLLSVSDGTGNPLGFNPGGGTGNYTYDANGNLTADPYKGIIKITYDVLNRTDSIKLSSTQYITYTYDASGSLVRKQAYKSGTTTTTDYIDGFNYVNGTLSYFPMPEGRVVNNSGNLTQQFVITDQLGNARISFQNNGSNTAVVTQENSYYGFGLILPNSPVNPINPANKQLYNGGSEWQNDYSNLPDYYQTYSRNYDAALGRFIGVDPIAESTESMSTYQYAGNNPIMINDPAGDKACAGYGCSIATSGSGNTGDSGFGSPSLDDFFAQVQEDMMINAAMDDEYQPGGTEYVGHNIGYGQNGQMVSVENGLNTDTYYNWDEITPVFAEALAAAGLGSSASATSSSLELAPTDINPAQISGTSTSNGNIQSNVAGANPLESSIAATAGYPVGFKEYADLIIAESSSYRDALGIGSVIINRINSQKTSLNDPNWVDKVGHKGAYNGFTNNIYKAVDKMSIDQILNSKDYRDRFLGALQAFSNWGTDYSGMPGATAYYWTSAGYPYGYAYQQWLQGNMIRFTIDCTTFYAFKISSWQWTP